MNIDTIKKYKNEFDHFVNGGKLLCARARDYKLNWLKATGNHPEFFNTNDEYYIYIIDDEYVEFRKALAEGKTIQIYDVIEQHISDPSLDRFEWRDFKSFTPSSSFSKTPDLYRIKPDEPKFKVGDFVTPLNRDINYSVWKIDKVLSCNTLVSGSTMLDPRTIKPWTPVKGEWCWFCDNKSSKSAALAKFNKINNNYFISITDMHWQFCEPFLNSIPSYLKDK